jgi:hypothetical protein
VRKRKTKTKTGRIRPPIIDGDARPDIPLDPEKKANHPEGKKGNDKFTKERMSDINSLEDYKDAKE